MNRTRFGYYLSCPLIRHNLNQKLQPPPKKDFDKRGFPLKEKSPKEEKKMESITEKQIIALKKFAKNPELSKGILKEIEFKDLDKQQASELITKCINHTNNTHAEEGEDKSRYSQNFKDVYGIFRIATLTDEEIATIREAHRQHCKEILNECRDEYPGEPDVQLAVFSKRCDKIFSWIQQALDGKVRQCRN
jgi:hypothetical protein